MSDAVLPAELIEQPEWVDELDEALLVGGDVPERAKAWQIEDLGGAEWVMRRFAAVTRRLGEVHDQAGVWRSRVDAWEAEERNRVAGAHLYFKGLLERWAITQRTLDPKRASFDLPSGRVETRRGKEPKVEIEDEAAVIEWAADALSGDEYEDCVAQKLSVRISELRKYVAIKATTVVQEDAEGAPQGRTEYQVVHAGTGEVVPGLWVEEPMTVPTVKPYV